MITMADASHGVSKLRHAGALLLVIAVLFTRLTDGPMCSAAEPPNFVVVFIDDMGWQDFSCFGNDDAVTDHIDGLAREGIRFEQFYVNSPICSPSRVAISTGQYPMRWRITSYLSNRQDNERRGIADWLDPNAPMLARILSDTGYATGHFGKWHMGGQRDVGEAPLITDYGFDESLTNFEGLGPRILPLRNNYDGSPTRRHGLGSQDLGRGPIEWRDRSQITRLFTEGALDFIRRAERNGQPFYVNVWPDDVHGPFHPPADRRGDGSRRALYLGVLETMDEQLGPLFDHIRNSEALRERTWILICSDNGPDRDAGSAGPFRGMKTMLYEGGIRSPLVVWGPGFIAPQRAGSVNRTSCFAAIDLVPSLIAAAGVEGPPDAVFDGENVLDILQGESDRSRNRPLYFRRPPDRDSFFGVDDLPDLAMRDGHWKLLCEFDGSSLELYDLEADPGEARNLATERPKRAARMTSALLEWNRSMPADRGPELAGDAR